jgi:hypothetical protein
MQQLSKNPILARQQLSKNITTAMTAYATVKEPLDSSLSVLSM